MPRSIHDAEVVKLINEARLDRNRFHPSPIDWRDQWIYFILIDRFSNSQQEPNHSPWDQPYDKFQGGTFNGIRDHLDYLKEMGVGAIWLSPVLKNAQYKEASYHGYGIQDFLAIEPRFSSDPERARQDPTFPENELRQLVDAIHQHGMYIIFDIILNHVGSVFSYRTDAGNAEDVPWREEGKYDILWHDEKGRVEQEWSEPPTQGGKNEELTSKISQDALIWPQELQRNDYFRRQGNAFTRAQEDGERAGDFNSLKELVTDYVELRPILRTLLSRPAGIDRRPSVSFAKYDIDGFSHGHVEILGTGFRPFIRDCHLGIRNRHR
ncbi:MAG: hypothetical protein KF726_17370 [Anaerolineae bacterium]|nr:hypothetical protein [Anaerolineae bacterium]